MKYKIVESNVLISVGEGVGETQITDEEYDRALAAYEDAEYWAEEESIERYFEDK